MSSKFQNFMLVAIAFVVILVYLRRPEKQIPIVQDIQVTQPENRSIKVSSEGIVQVIPDTADFEIAIRSEGLDLDEAKRTNEELTQEALTVLDGYLIPEDDIRVDFLRVKVNAGASQIYGYTVNNVIKVTVRDLSILEPVITSLQEKGKSDMQLSRVTFSLSRINQYEEQALQTAVDAAKEKAQAVARKLGLKIGNVIAIEQSSSNPSGLYIGDYSWYPTYPTENLLAIAFSEITIKVLATVTFELK